MAPKIDAKSMKNRGGVADAFLKQPLGAKRGVRHLSVIPILGAIFDKKSKKGIKKGMHKSMPKSIEN